jgi:hypothetical protein
VDQEVPGAHSLPQKTTKTRFHALVVLLPTKFSSPVLVANQVGLGRKNIRIPQLIAIFMRIMIAGWKDLIQELDFLLDEKQISS